MIPYTETPPPCTDVPWVYDGCAEIRHDSSAGFHAEDLTEAKATCAVCPIRDACYTDAVQRRERHGVWGGVLFASRRPRTIRAAHKTYTNAELMAEWDLLRRDGDTIYTAAPRLGITVRSLERAIYAATHRRPA